MPITAHSIPEPEARAVAAGRPGETEGETGRNRPQGEQQASGEVTPGQSHQGSKAVTSDCRHRCSPYRTLWSTLGFRGRRACRSVAGEAPPIHTGDPRDRSPRDETRKGVWLLAQDTTFTARILTKFTYLLKLP